MHPHRPSYLPRQNQRDTYAFEKGGVIRKPELQASLKDDTARMNDRNKYKVTGQMNHVKFAAVPVNGAALHSICTASDVRYDANLYLVALKKSLA